MNRNDTFDIYMRVDGPEKMEDKIQQISQQVDEIEKFQNDQACSGKILPLAFV